MSVYHVGADSSMVAKVLETTASCGRYLDTRYGKRRPLPPVKMVLAPRDGPGYARKNYIVITTSADTSAVGLGRYICHELAHYYAPIVAQWREQGEGQPPVWKPDLASRPTARTAYRKAPYLLSLLEERVGSEVMDRILVRFMTEPLRTTPSLLEMIEQVAGAPTAAWFQQQLST
ncbi:MAG: hypothetical protein ACT4PJ_14060 [Gemmatimonadaceae bacterium]